ATAAPPGPIPARRSRLTASSGGKGTSPPRSATGQRASHTRRRSNDVRDVRYRPEADVDQWQEEDGAHTVRLDDDEDCASPRPDNNLDLLQRGERGWLQFVSVLRSCPCVDLVRRRNVRPGYRSLLSRCG